jgi:hypothetical protein
MLKKGQNVKITIDGSYFKKGQIVEVSEPDKYGAWLLGDDKYGSYNDWYFKYGDFDVVDSVVESIIEKFRERSAVGINKYGTTLDRDDYDLIDWLIESQQEAMDFVLYCEAAVKKIKERGSKNS